MRATRWIRERILVLGITWASEIRFVSLVLIEPRHAVVAVYEMIVRKVKK